VTAAVYHHHRMAARDVRCGGDDIGINRSFGCAGIQAARTATGGRVSAPARGILHRCVSRHGLASCLTFAGMLGRFIALDNKNA